MTRVAHILTEQQNDFFRLILQKEQSLQGRNQFKITENPYKLVFERPYWGHIVAPPNAGKTIMALALSQCTNTPFNERVSISNFNFSMTPIVQVIQTTFIIVPSVTLGQWEATCDALQMSYKVIKTHKEIFDMDLMALVELKKCSCVLISGHISSVLFEHIQVFSVFVQRLIIDEAPNDYQWIMNHSFISWTMQPFVSSLSRHPDFVLAMDEYRFTGALPPLFQTLEYEPATRLTTRQFERDLPVLVNRNRYKDILQHIKFESLESMEKRHSSDILQRVQSDICPICFDQIASNKRVVTPCCMNPCCVGCISGWLVNRKACPICRRNLKVSQLIALTGSKLDCVNSKYEQLYKALDSGAIQFPCMVFTLKSENPKVKEMITGPVYIMTESVSSVLERNVKKFKKNEIKCFIVNEHSAFPGIHFDFVKTIVFMDKCNNQLRDKIVSRCERSSRFSALKIIDIVVASNDLVSEIV